MMEEKYKDWFFQHDALMTELRNMLDGEEPPPPPPPPPSDRKDVAWWPSRNTTAGATAFPLAMRDRAYIRDLVQYLKENGYNTVSVGAQTDAWADNNVAYLPVGPEFGTGEWRTNLETMLDETARSENFWVQLIPTFTHKGRGGFDYQRSLCKKVAHLVRDGEFKHVIWNVMNEFKHPITHDSLKDEHILYLGQELQDITGLPVSTDHGGREKDIATGERVWKAYYPTVWRAFDFYAFHPTRNPEPTGNQFKKAAKRWPDKTLLYNETVCFASDYDMERWPVLKGKGTIACGGRGTEDERKWAIRSIKENIRNAGPRSRFFFHSIWLGIRAEGIGWIPRY